MAINYDKWNKIEDYSSEENDDDTPLSYIKNSNENKTGKLITIPWDTHCEKVRWAMDLYQTKYVEYGYPYLLHVWYIIDEYSEAPPTPQVVDVPILEFDNQVYKNGSTEIFTFLYSRALGSKLRIYSKPEALTHEKYFDENLAPAAKTIFYDMVLPSKKLCEEIIFSSIHLNTWRSIYRLIWPIAKMNMKNLLGVRNKKIQDDAWEKVENAFKYVDDLLAKSDGEFLLGKTMTAADITFAAHAIPILCPNTEEHIWFNENVIGIKCPSIKELPENLKSKVEYYRMRPSGAFAMKLYKNKRGKSSGSKPSRYAKENSPYWAQEFTLRRLVYGTFILCVLLGWFFVLTCPWYVSLVTYIIFSFALIQFIVKPLKQSKYGRRITRIMFCFFNNNGKENIKSHQCGNCSCNHQHENEIHPEDKKEQ
ncbi:hypothetical protein PIROE2DRAFT_57341 [Piromyces sp. E2]|nr:hypothetical protein PIROE2DRAFT_57341 [Piromyces sp. E2]|eukprot:OUM69626.1 hypothetical protein PIROE2DRAFT_57341 [Piromyces sp. E2]